MSRLLYFHLDPKVYEVERPTGLVVCLFCKALEHLSELQACCMFCSGRDFAHFFQKRVKPSFRFRSY